MTIRQCMAVVLGEPWLFRAIAEHLAAAGARVTSARDGEAAEAAVERAAHEGPLGILVTAFRSGRTGRLEDLQEEDWTASTTAVVARTALACRAALGPMRQQRFGRIVLVAERSHLGAPGEAAPSVAAAGLVSLARSLAREVAADGITVNCVVLGAIDFGQMAGVAEDQRERLRKLHPVGRLGQPADVACAVAFFAAEESGYITGQTLFVCGGTSLYSSLSV